MRRVIFILLLSASCLHFSFAQSDLINSTKFFLYQGLTTNDVSIVYPIAEAERIVAHLNSNLKTVIYLHGYRENQTSMSLKTVINSFLLNGNYNVLTFDWQLIAAKSYGTIVFQHFLPLSEKFGEALIRIINAGLDIKSIYLVGFSLGAQIAGKSSDNILRNENLIFERITGLDPAGPFFSEISFTLNSKCAKFVDIYHTDMCQYGTQDITGHADILPNCGKRTQPFCPRTISMPMTPNAICSHHMSWRYFSESINPSNGVKFIGFNPKTNDTLDVGLNCPSTARGTFYLTTNAESPFAKGLEGLSDGSNCGIPCLPIF